MATVHLHRATANTDRLRAYKVLVDDVEQGAIKQGETLAVDVSVGPHRVRMAIDWCGSPEVEIDGGADTRLTCAAAASPFTALFRALFARNAYIDLWPG